MRIVTVTGLTISVTVVVIIIAMISSRSQMVRMTREVIFALFWFGSDPHAKETKALKHSRFLEVTSRWRVI